MTSLSCSIVVRAYNEEKHIGRLLTGISQQNLKEIEVILVDSFSKPRYRSIKEKLYRHRERPCLSGLSGLVRKNVVPLRG